MISLPASISRLFETAGWRHERRVEVARDVPHSHPAFALLQEFGSLKVGNRGSGEECATSDLDIRFIASDDTESIARWERALETTLICIGECDGGYSQVLMSSSGRVFANGVISAELFVFLGFGFAEAAERLLLGQRCRPLILPGEYGVTIYGERYPAGSPLVIGPPYTEVR